MRAMVPKLLGVPLARDTDYQPEVAGAPGLDPRDGILDDHTACRVYPKQLRCHQVRIRCGLPGQVLRTDRVAVDAHVKEVIQLGGLPRRRVTRSRCTIASPVLILKCFPKISVAL